MTGTGTQADPYIVDNWTDFVTAVGTSDAYVEFVENTVIEMNEVARTGIGSAINIQCTQLDGKNSTIRNLYLTDNANLYFQKANAIIKNFTISNVRRDGTSGSFLHFSQTATFNNCVITGSFGGESVISGVKSYFQSCAITAQVQDCNFAKSTYYDNRCPNFINSIVKTSGVVTTTGNAQIFIENSLIKGVLPATTIYRSNTSIIDCVVPDDTALRVTNGKAYVNSDKFGEGVTTTNCTLLTDEQLQDAEYLASVGFPIGV